MIKWNIVFKRLMELMDRHGTSSYFSGARFIRIIQQFDENVPNYGELIAQRNRAGRSTTRRDYFKDLLMDIDEGTRVRAVGTFLDELGDGPDADVNAVSQIRTLLGGGTLAPSAIIPPEAWNADRLNDYLKEIDGAIAAANYERAVTLSYTCLEGFLGAFVRAKEKRGAYSNEIITLAKEVKAHLKTTFSECPDEILNGVTQSAHAVDKARNRFSESHFADEAASWLATYIRDVVNTQIRLLLHFM